MTMTDYIRDDITASLKSASGLPCKLTLNALSKHYGVSLTPVRHAVEELVVEGVVCRKDNGRLEPGKITAKTKRRKVVAPREDRNRELAEIIRQEVVKRSIRGDSEYLREQAMAEKLGAGRTVVRQVFSSLAGAGLLEHVPRCGWRVIPFSESDMHDFLSIREMMELKALELSMPRLDSDELLELQNKNLPSARSGQSKLDDGLHQYWIDRCDNRYIQDFFARYGVFYNTLFNSAAVEEPVKCVMAQEHRDIIDHMLEGDLRGAQKHLKKHIRDQQDNVSRMISLLSSD
jgi:DNA-binding GntR family transcriptional regulator